MDGAHNLEDDLRDSIRKSVIDVCGKHDIEELSLTYRLSLNLSFEIKDEIVKTGD